MPIKWILFAGVLASYFISPYLPLSWGWENNLLEWLQVIILSVGFVLNFKWYQDAKATDNSSAPLFLASTLPLWLLMIGRELSWGRVFYPSGFNPIEGPTFLSLAQLPYGAIVNPLLAIIIVVWLFVVIKYGLYKIPYQLLQERRFPTSELIIAVLALVIAGIGEKQLHLPAMEEFDECIAYLGLVLTAYRVKDALN